MSFRDPCNTCELNHFIFPGTFSPPTLGHLHVVKKIAEVVPQLTIVCSINPDKEAWFTPEECKTLWSSYAIPNNVGVTTIEAFKRAKQQLKQQLWQPERIVIVRGIRDPSDLTHEAGVMQLNKEQFKIDTYLYVLCDDAFKGISSSQARQLAEAGDVEKLKKCVSGIIATALIDRATIRKLRRQGHE